MSFAGREAGRNEQTAAWINGRKGGVDLVEKGNVNSRSGSVFPPSLPRSKTPIFSGDYYHISFKDKISLQSKYNLECL